MDRRDFISSTAAPSLARGALPITAHAQARPKSVLVVANEFGTNSLDIHTWAPTASFQLQPDYRQLSKGW